jgi:Pyridoxamine 5'-phosphate oxidase
MADKRVTAAEAVVKSIKTGERSASERAREHLTQDVVLEIVRAQGSEEIKGVDQVLFRLGGIWAFTPIYQRGAWSEPSADGDKLKVDGIFPDLGAAPSEMHLTFSFNGDGKITRVAQETVMGRFGPPQQVDEIPTFLRGQIDSALFNNTPLVVCYVDADGQPQQSLRGSTLVFSPTQLAIWVRNADGGIIKAMASNPKLSLLYRDSNSRSTIVVQGRGQVATDEETRRRLYDMTPEVEQMHDPDRKGAALIIDVVRLQGGGPKGNFRMQRD